SASSSSPTTRCARRAIPTRCCSGSCRRRTRRPPIVPGGTARRWSEPTDCVPDAVQRGGAALSGAPQIRRQSRRDRTNTELWTIPGLQRTAALRLRCAAPGKRCIGAGARTFRYAGATTEPTMRFGLFASPQADGSARSAPGQGFHDFTEFCVEAEALGFHSVFAVEHHFSGWTQVSATLTLLTFLAARTRTLRLGTAVMVLPWHNPVLLAEQAATLDLLSDGRLDLGVGKGYRHNEFKGFGIPIEDADARFEEALDVITRAWTARERFSHHGRFWHFDDVVVEPPTRQKPHPPLWMAAASEASLRRVAARCHNLILDQFASVELTGQRLALFRREVEARGRAFDPMSVTVARDMHVATSPADK